MNEAKYSFLPKFKQEPEMKKYMKDISDAEILLNSEGIETKTGIQKGFKIVFRVLDIIWNIGSILTLPMCPYYCWHSLPSNSKTICLGSTNW